MRYVKTGDIAIGDRFAKSIYNKDGVLLFNAGVKIDASMITRLKEMNLYGTYLLDAAEPVPPITPEELEFERFQWAQTYVVDEILTNVIRKKPNTKLDDLINLLYSRFGNRNEKMLFNQCLRGENDFISKHSLNVAVLCTILAKRQRMEMKECKYLIEAALFHDIGRLLLPKEILHKDGKLSPEEMDKVHKCLIQGFQIFANNYEYPAGMRRYIIQLMNELTNKLPAYPRVEQKLLPGTKILQVADIYDTLTAIRSYKSPMSAFTALKIMREEPTKYDSDTVDLLEECIHILPTGSYVMLTNGEQGIIVRENNRNLLRPVVLGLRTNTLYDLSMKETFSQIQIEDTVFTPDNRQRVEVDVSKIMKIQM